MRLYKPTAANKGAALSINYTAKTDKGELKGDKSFYWQIVSQSGWNPDTKTGSFKEGKKIITKFAPHEIGAMLAAIKRNISMADAMGVKYVYHDSETPSTISFEPHFKSVKGNDGIWTKTTTQNGFLYKVTKGDKKDESKKDSIAIGLNWAELELLRVVLEDGLSHVAGAWYAENIARGTEAKEKAKNTKSVPKEELKVEEPLDSNASAPPDLDF